MESGAESSFIDGNKRTTFDAVYTLLAINGYRVTANAEGTYDFVNGLNEMPGLTSACLQVVTWEYGRRFLEAS